MPAEHLTVNGKKIVRYRSDAPVSMGGIVVAPRGGHSIAVDVGGAVPRVASRDASVSMAPQARPSSSSPAGSRGS